MKNLISSLFIYCLALTFLNFRFADDFSAFETTSRDVHERLWSVLQHNGLHVPYLSNNVKTACRAFAGEEQAAAVKKIGGLCKAYYASDDFKKRYQDWLAKTFTQTAIQLPERRIKEIRDDRQKNVDMMKEQDVAPVIDMQIQANQSFAEMGSMVNSLPAEQRAEFKKQVDNGKRNVLEYKKLKQLLKTDYAAFKKQYAELQAQEQINQELDQLTRNNKSNAAEFEKWKDPKKVLSAKLGEFLAKTQGVDFAAQTKLVNGRKKFVNGSYEGKNDLWKFCYRMGQAPTNAARNFAQQWQTELKNNI
ncbi:hypothetical protein [Dyadobacter sp. LHD-138]|uniref:hypothetical protein n=1 Tax=Dyadobacter sp. LHD-138 TaxID=3071413 RepID=UPI0027DF55E6|nr:hypothetical protein [Dyadobacter sp. LHD-138]MDQ6482453.1 hypothetical protein [Dyadobacter sp. LHD-138]